MPTTKLSEIIRRNPPMAGPTDSIRRVALLMLDAGLRAIAVLENGKLVGILSERHITEKVVAQGRDPKTTCVCDAMDDKPVRTSSDRRIDSTVLVMQARGVQALIVQDFTGKVIGAVTDYDLLVAGEAR